MKHTFRRLLCLTLVLLTALVPVSPVLAQTTDSVRDLTPWIDYSAELPFRPRQALANTMTTANTTDITVDGTAFSSASDQTGDGWTYTADGNLLTLNNYDGGSILSEGSLNIRTTGNVVITGEDGKSGICVKNQLTIDVADGTLTVTGGSVNTNDVFSGYGILGLVKTAITGSGQVAITGGSNPNGTGGIAVYGGQVELSVDGTYTGGSGRTGAAAAGAMIQLILGVADVMTADFCGGKAETGSYAKPISLYKEDSNQDGIPEYEAKWSLNVHLVLSNPDAQTNALHVEPAKYTLTFQGEGVDAQSFTKPYPAAYKLADHRFTRDGFVQVGWKTADGSQLGLDWTLIPEANLTLTAAWQALSDDTIVLQGTNGTFSAAGAGTIGAADSLPEAITGTKTLLAWCTELSPTANETLAFSGSWYAGGQQADAGVQTLYAQTADNGRYLILHPTTAAVKQGGTILVYGTTQTDSDRSVTPDLTAMTAPAGFTFRGWATQDGEILYGAGDAIPLTDGVTVLYAQWAYPVDTDLDLTWDAEADSAVLTGDGLSGVATVICAAYDGSGKQTMVRTLPVTEAAAMTLPADALTGDTCRLFFLTADHTPAAAAVELDLEALRK